MARGQYILAEDGRTPVLCSDLHAWARWYEKSERHVERDQTPNGRVSTVFLGLDHNYNGGPPLLWETMVFGGEFDEYQERYATYEDAVEGHARMLAKVKASSQSVAG